MPKKLLCGLAMLFGLSVGNGALAADIPVKAPAPIQAPPVISTWAGPYIGFEIGGKWTKSDTNTFCVQGSALDPFNCGGTANPFTVDSSSPQQFKNSGLRTGVYAGVNWQTWNWVYGVEGDWAYYNQSSTVAGLVGCSTAACTGGVLVPFSLVSDSTTVRIKEDASLRARLGYVLFPSVLLYGTGGVAWQKMSATMTCGFLTSPGCSLFNLSQTNTRSAVGWTVGGGIEWMFWQNWILRGEYRYSDFGNWKNTFFPASGDIELLTNTKVTTQIATVGLAYRFDFAR